MTAQQFSGFGAAATSGLKDRANAEQLAEEFLPQPGGYPDGYRIGLGVRTG